MADYELKITKATKDITSSTPSDYHFWSKYRAKSVKYQGSLNVTTNGGTDPATATNSYSHNFGYLPQFMVFTTSALMSYYMNAPWYVIRDYGKGAEERQDETIGVYVTSTTIVVSALWHHYVPQSGTSTGIINTYTFDILLFMEEIETS